MRMRMHAKSGVKWPAKKCSQSGGVAERPPVPASATPV